MKLIWRESDRQRSAIASLRVAPNAYRSVKSTEVSTFRLAHQTDVDFPIDVPPFLCLSKRSNQLFKRLGMLGSVFKPRQKVEGFADIAAMIKLPCDGW